MHNVRTTLHCFNILEQVKSETLTERSFAKQNALRKMGTLRGCTMLWLVVLLLLSSCKKNDASTLQTDSLNLTGATGRNLTIEVSDLNKSRSKGNEHRICAFSLAGNEAFKKEILETRLVCESNVDENRVDRIQLKNLPYPAYITIFHDENLNSVLDFATFNIIIARKQGPIEGIAAIKDADNSIKFSKPIWVEVGENQGRAHLVYDSAPFWQFIREQSWQYLYSWYLEKAHATNHNGKPKNPFCTRAEECL